MSVYSKHVYKKRPTLYWCHNNVIYTNNTQGFVSYYFHPKTWIAALKM